MSRKHSTIQIRLYLAGAVILVGGLVSAAWIYLAATNDTNKSEIVGYEFVNGQKYAIRKSDSKRYQHEMERLGGKFNVDLDEFNEWLSGLWHGKRLAYTIAILSLVAALACYWIAQHPDYKLPDNTDDR
jgi:hypothetical protein